MRLFGFDITRSRQSLSTAVAVVDESKSLPSAVPSGGGWYPIIREAFTGAWQKGIHTRPETILSHNAVFACTTLIASDISKLRIKLMEKDSNGIWNEVTSPGYSPVLEKPNNYQNRIQFLEAWVISKLNSGNAYLLKQRDNRNVVTDLHVLDPNRCKPLVTPDGTVFYQLGLDWLAGTGEQVACPASEIIHDRWNCLFHPLVGVGPIFACGLAASQGLNIQRTSAAFFANGARPGGMLTAPGKIDDDTAKRLKEHWQAKYTGENSGGVVVLGNGLAYQPLTMNAADSQLIDQLKMSAEMVCSAYHVPPWMLGLAELPARVAIEALTQQYYSQCLQILIESIEICLDEGLEVDTMKGRTLGTELDLDGLLRMDQASQIESVTKGILGGLFAPNEGRKRFDLKPVPGGDNVTLQQQNFSLAALAKRDAQDDPFGAKPAAPAPAPAPAPAAEPVANDNAAAKAAIARRWERSMANARRG